MLTIPICIQHSSGDLSPYNVTRKIKGIHRLGREENLALLTDNMIRYTEKSRESTVKLLELIRVPKGY